jgi:hypothetical protein
MKNLEIIKVHALLNNIKANKSAIRIKVKVLRNLQMIEKQITLYKELEAALTPEEITVYSTKYNELLEAKCVKLENNQYQLNEEANAAIAELKLEFAEPIAAYEANIKAHNEFLQEEVTENYKFIQFITTEIDDLEITDDLTEVLHYLINI